jgi:hypothetical protein
MRKRRDIKFRRHVIGVVGRWRSQIILCRLLLIDHLYKSLDIPRVAVKHAADLQAQDAPTFNFCSSVPFSQIAPSSHSTINMAVLNSAASKPLLKLSHRASLTLHDYSQNAHLISNPPYCEMPYHSLNTSRKTPMCGITNMACVECVHVCGQADCEELLVADRCTGAERDLDISTEAGWGSLVRALASSREWNGST